MFDAEEVAVILGKHNLSRDEPGELKVQVKTVILHDKYNSTTNDYDIGLLELTQDVTFTSHIHPACLPKEDVEDEAMCITTGWGTTGNCLVIGAGYICGCGDATGGRIVVLRHLIRAVHRLPV